MHRQVDLDKRIESMVEVAMRGYGADNVDYFERWLETYRQIADEFAHEAARAAGGGEHE